MRHKYNKRSQAGISLIEMLACLVVLAVVINLGATLYVSMHRMHRSGEKSMELTTSIKNIQREFRQAAAKSCAVRAAAGTFQTSSDCLVLEMTPDTESGAKNFIVFQAAADAGKLYLRKFEISTKGNEHEITGMKTYVLLMKEVNFTSGPNGGMAVIEFVAADEETPQREAPRHKTIAALGGIAA